MPSTPDHTTPSGKTFQRANTTMPAVGKDPYLMVYLQATTGSMGQANINSTLQLSLD